MKILRAASWALIVTSVVALNGCGFVADLNTDDSFEDRIEALAAVYDQGKVARKSMEKLGVIVDETSCGSSWVTSGAKDAENDMPRGGTGPNEPDVAFQNLRHLSFINGCMDRPNDLPATNAPTLPPASPPVSAEPSASLPSPPAPTPPA